MKRKNGFTLIELMIVVAIIAIIVAIAIPNLLRSRMSANESGAAAGLRTISTGEVAYQAAAIESTTNGIGKFGTLPALGTGSVPFVDLSLASGIKQGYNFQATPTFTNNVPSFTATATPAVAGRTGVKSFFIDDSGLLRFEGGGATPTSNSPPVNY